MSERAVRRGEVLWRVAPGYLVVGSADGRLVEIGGSADKVWAALPAPGAVPIAVQALTRQLAALHEVPEEVAARDVEAVLAALETIGAVDDQR